MNNYLSYPYGVRSYPNIGYQPFSYYTPPQSYAYNWNTGVEEPEENQYTYSPPNTSTSSLNLPSFLDTTTKVLDTFKSTGKIETATSGAEAAKGAAAGAKGGGMDAMLGKGMAVAQGAMALYDTIKKNSAIQDTSQFENDIKRTETLGVNSTNNASLSNEFQTGFHNTNSIGVSTQASTGEKIMNTAMGSAQTALAGFTVGGPIGAIVGGVIGLAGGIGSAIAGDKAAFKKQQELRTRSTLANIKRGNALTDRLHTIDRTNNRNMFNYFSDGGSLTQYQGGGTHEENPYGGIPVGMGENGLPNMVEEGETKYDDYVYSDRTVPKLKDFFKLYGLYGNFADKSFAQVSKKLEEESKERPYDNISKRGLQDSMNKLKRAQEDYKKLVGIAQNAQIQNRYDWGGALSKATTMLRYAPILGSIGSVISDSVGKTNTVDPKEFDVLNQYISRDTFSPQYLRNKLQYTPFDNEYMLNKVQAQNNAQREAIVRASGLNPSTAISGLVGMHRASQDAMANAYRQEAEATFNRKMQVAQFNNQVDMQNNNLALQAAQSKAQLNNILYQNALRRLQMYQQLKAQASAARSQNYTNMLDNLGGLGREQYTMNMLRSNPALLYALNNYGNVGYKGGATGKTGK